MVYQAVAEYWASAKEPDYDLNVDIMLPGRARPERINLNKANSYSTRTSKVSTYIRSHKYIAMIYAVSSADLCACISIPSDEGYQPGCDGDRQRIGRSDSDGNFPCTICCMSTCPF